jgi:transcriptional regulator with XRE-family HTH domain
MDTQVLESLNRAIGSKGLSISQISEKLEIDRSIFNKFVNGQRIPNIEVIYKILHYLFPNNQERYKIFRSLVPSFKTIQPLKVMVEMARLNRDEETVLQAANIIKNASKQKDKEWADFYLLWQDFRSGVLDKDQYLESLVSFPIQSDELKAFRILTLCHYHLSISNQYETALEYCLKAKPVIDPLPPSLLKNSYLARYYGYQGQLLMRKFDVENTITLLEKSNIFSISDLMRGINIYNMTAILRFTDYQKACDYLQDVATNLRQFVDYDPGLGPLADYFVQELVPLTKIYSYDLEGIQEEKLLYPSSQFMYHFRSGNHQKAREILDNLSEEDKDHEFYVLCEGILEKSIPILLKSLSKWIEKYELHEGQFAIRELQKLGCDQLIIDSMVNARLGSRKTHFYT